MLGTVNLHQLTQTIAPRPRLMDALQPVFPPNPKAGADYPLPQCLDPKVQAMKLAQLLGRQCRTKIAIVLAHDGQHGLAEHRTQGSIARLAAFPRDQAVRTVSSERLQQTVGLSPSDANKPGRVRDR